MRAVALACCLAVASAAQAEEPRVDRDESQDRLGRVAAELGASVLGAALPNVLWLPFFLSASPFGGPSGAMVVMAAMTVLLEPLSISTASWLVHRRMGGRGLWPAALGGTFLGLAIGGGMLGGVTALVTSNVKNGNRTTYIGIAGVGAVAIAVVTTAFMIELHHDQTIEAGVAPLPGGAVGTVSMRF